VNDIRATAGRDNPGDANRLRISIIIPIWRDADTLAEVLPKLSRTPGADEIIVVNASRDLGSERTARDYGATFLRSSPPNRGVQMNAGAKIATGDVLLFQHVDAELTEAHLAAIDRAFQNRRVVGGAFYRKFDERHPGLRWLEGVTRFLSRHGGTLYGDQSLFVRRDVFERIGGFQEIPLMEDVDFSRTLRAAGKIALLDPPMRSSARWHLRRGPWRTTMRNAWLILLYKLGASPFRLHRRYYPAVEFPTDPRHLSRDSRRLAAN